MELQSVFKALEGYQKGSFARVGWFSHIESASARKQGITVTEVSTATVRIGIKYSNIHSVKIQRETQKGESKPYTVWFKHMEQLPAIIEHLKDENKKYLQLFPVNKNSYRKIKYYVNGIERTQQEVIESGYCSPSAFAKSETVMFNIPIENLEFIGSFN